METTDELAEHWSLYGLPRGINDLETFSSQTIVQTWRKEASKRRLLQENFNPIENLLEQKPGNTYYRKAAPLFQETRKVISPGRVKKKQRKKKSSQACQGITLSADLFS